MGPSSEVRAPPSLWGPTGPVQVTPNSGYVLAAYNTTTRQWEAVPNNTMLPGPGSYTLIPSNNVPHISSLSAKLRRVSGGRTAVCKTPPNTTGRVASGCQLLKVTAPARSRLSVTVPYPGAPKTQRFGGTSDRRG